MSTRRRYRMILGVVAASLLVVATVTSSKTNEQHLELRSMKYTSRPADDAITWQRELRSTLFTLLRMEDLVSREANLPFNQEEISSEDKGTFELKELAINSTANRRIRIIMTIPKHQKGPFPAVVCIGGHRSHKLDVYESNNIYNAFASVLAAQGYITISADVDQPCKTIGKPHQAREEGRTLMGERIWDQMRCVDYLESLPEVDRARIGCAGLSLGGEMAMWLGAMDERIAVTVSAGFLTSMAHLIEHHHCPCWRFEGLTELVDFPDIYALIAPRPLQCQNGLREPPQEFYVPVARKSLEEIRITFVNLEKPENVYLDVHEKGHEMDIPSLMWFFEKHLQNNRYVTK